MIWPPPAVLARRNRRILAERLRLPYGVVEMCEDMECRFPGWHVDYLRACTVRGLERPAGFRARLADDGLELFATDASRLAAALNRAAAGPS